MENNLTLEPGQTCVIISLTLYSLIFLLLYLDRSIKYFLFGTEVHDIYFLCSIFQFKIAKTMSSRFNPICNSSDEEDSLSEGEERVSEKLFNKVVNSSGNKLSPEEWKMLNTYTYDKEPIKAWRQVNDYIVMKECNAVKWNKISELLGKFHGYPNSLALYRSSKSCLVNLIERIMCEEKCYYLPEKCFLRHGFDLQYLMEKSVHEKYPQFAKLFSEAKSQKAELQIESNGRPKLNQLANDIGFSTALEYSEEGIVNINFGVLKEEFWNQERPCFVKEENKILNVILALLISSSEKQEDERVFATQKYSQTLSDVNEPTLKIMCHGPDIDFEAFVVEDDECDINKDEEMVKNTLLNVKHERCSSFKRDNHWKYVHGETGRDGSTCDHNDGMILEGPASEKESLAVSYPCDLKNCWKCCDCKLCILLRMLKCDNHKEHMKYNIKDCLIQQTAQCQEHWIDHPENFKPEEDIQIDKKILFHNNLLLKNGQNYTHKSVRYAGLKQFCKKCRKNTKEHLNKHLAPHAQCKHCQFEMKTLQDKSFWRKVCTICGKLFDSERLRNLHANRHDVVEEECEICEQKFCNKFTFHRHLLEQHNSLIENSPDTENSTHHEPENQLKCEVCSKTFKYLRNLKAHVLSTHRQKEGFQCMICALKISSRSHLKRHLEEQHKVFDLDKEIETKANTEASCNVCGIVFTRKESLEIHKKIHSKVGEKLTCNDCGKQCVTKYNLTQHQKIHNGDRERFQCDLCQKTFSAKRSLIRHLVVIHQPTIFPCELCEKSFNRADNLDSHVKKYHG